MSYPRIEIRKVENGYILQVGRTEYIADNFIEAIVTLAKNYHEEETAEVIINFCKLNAGKKWEDMFKDELPNQEKALALAWTCVYGITHIAEGDTFNELLEAQKCDCGKINQDKIVIPTENLNSV